MSRILKNIRADFKRITLNSSDVNSSFDQRGINCYNNVLSTIQQTLVTIKYGQCIILLIKKNKKKEFQKTVIIMKNTEKVSQKNMTATSIKVGIITVLLFFYLLLEIYNHP